MFIWNTSTSVHICTFSSFMKWTPFSIEWHSKWTQFINFNEKGNYKWSIKKNDETECQVKVKKYFLTRGIYTASEWMQWKWKCWEHVLNVADIFLIHTLDVITVFFQEVNVKIILFIQMLTRTVLLYLQVKM